MTPSPTSMGFHTVSVRSRCGRGAAIKKGTKINKVRFSLTCWPCLGCQERSLVTASAETPGARGNWGRVMPQFHQRAPLRLQGWPLG